ncbi:hypothetical protein ATANTOWER_027077 [Ataeniobius toweri]|uniref:Uncharacterized protein n=1 Tax=Ataeniobius toweri TaxID=208326 RepID=A0ABU7ASB5_9TELE|nr:hypothetical protein [Ataeniobius toweri]
MSPVIFCRRYHEGVVSSEKEDSLCGEITGSPSSAKTTPTKLHVFTHMHTTDTRTRMHSNSPLLPLGVVSAPLLLGSSRVSPCGAPGSLLQQQLLHSLLFFLLIKRFSVYMTFFFRQ